jgi:hypothetical protein
MAVGAKKIAACRIEKSKLPNTATINLSIADRVNNVVNMLKVKFDSVKLTRLGMGRSGPSHV